MKYLLYGFLCGLLSAMIYFNTACSSPAPVVQVEVCANPETCVHIKPGLSTAVITLSWGAITTTDKGKPLVYPVETTGGYTVFLFDQAKTHETAFDIYVPDQEAPFDHQQPQYKIMNVGQYGFKVGDQVCLQVLAYNTVPVDGTPTRRDSLRSDILCIGVYH